MSIKISPTSSVCIYRMTFWGSVPGNGTEALVLVAQQIIAYFCINPYLLSLVDWRNYMKVRFMIIFFDKPFICLMRKWMFRR